MRSRFAPLEMLQVRICSYFNC